MPRHSPIPHKSRSLRNKKSMKRIILFVITNLAVMLVLSATLRILGVDRYLTANGLNLQALLIFSVVVGFTGAII